ncbi:MAG TPA: hypothetical protein VMK12_25845 [Anaeromyxobacteraceae bacterium]|nr:hypothetical protein [Anaeromyxobacteraceae bacterium]
MGAVQAVLVSDGLQLPAIDQAADEHLGTVLVGQPDSVPGSLARMALPAEVDQLGVLPARLELLDEPRLIAVGDGFPEERVRRHHLAPVQREQVEQPRHVQRGR